MKVLAPFKCIFLLLVTLNFKFAAQISSIQLGGITTTINPITTAVPFLLISPDSKQGAMGDVGVATDPDVQSTHWNVSKLAFADRKMAFGLTATPWLRNLVPDIFLYYLSSYYKINKRQTISSSLRYFTLGNIELTDAQGTRTGNFKPNEFALDLGFAQQLSKSFGLGVSMRYINSSISRAYFNGSSGNAENSVAVDLGGTYRPKTFSVNGKTMHLTSGFLFSNVGAKIKYSNDENFLPMNLRLGVGLKTEFDAYNALSVYFDVNKLLVPTPPVYKYKLDASGKPTTEIELDPSTGKRLIASGKDPNVDVVTGLFQSFNDAPTGFREELQELNLSFGTEYNYNNLLFVRGGYFYEPIQKGGRQFITLGFGTRLKVLHFDGSYLIPTSLNNPLQNTWRISLSFYFDEAGKESPEP